MSGPFDDQPTPPASLLEAQRFLLGAVRSREALAARAELHDGVRRIATGNARMTPVDQADVYREQYWIRHTSSLGEDFPTLKHLVGGEAPFQELCERYLEAYPPRDFLLRNLSADMPRFLAEDPRYANDPLLAECATVEWAFLDAFDSADPKPFDAASLAGASEDALMSAKLVMQAPLRLVATEHPIHELREALRNGETPPRPTLRRTHLAIFRTGDELRFFELEPVAFEVVRALVLGVPLDEACERAIAAGANESEIGEKLGQWFQWWTQWGWLERVLITSGS